MKNLSNLKVAVTGALGGIGIPTLSHLHSLGAQLIAIDIVEAEIAHKVLAESGVTVDSYHQVDITDSKAISSLIDSFKVNSIPDALVSLAGIVHVGAIQEQSEESIREVFEVNVIGQTLIAQAFIKQWLATDRSGNIIFTSSWIDHVPWPSVTPYSASKAAIVAISRGIARAAGLSGARGHRCAAGDGGFGDGRESDGKRSGGVSRAPPGIKRVFGGEAARISGALRGVAAVGWRRSAGGVGGSSA